MVKMKMTHTGSIMYQCWSEGCSYTASGERGIRLHMWHSHSERVSGKASAAEMIPVCEVCSRVLRGADAVRRHHSEFGHLPMLATGMI